MLVSLVNAGRANSEHPKRFYRVALIDPTDRPFATFRYFYRTWDQLYEIDVVEENQSEYAGTETEYSIIEPGSPGDANSEALSGSGPGTPRRARIVNGDGLMRDISDLHAQTFDDSPTPRRSEFKVTPPQARNSESCVPPPVQLDPPKFSLKFSPQKLLTRDKKEHMPVEMESKPPGRYPMDEWVVRTPSPVKSMREGISTPPLTPRKGFTATGIFNAITNTLRRRGGPGSESSADNGSRSTSRNASR